MYYSFIRSWKLCRLCEGRIIFENQTVEFLYMKFNMFFRDSVIEDNPIVWIGILKV